MERFVCSFKMYLLWIGFVLGGFVSSNEAFLNSLYAQLSSNCSEVGAYACRNSQCVTKYQRCDGHNDCMDNSDEEECGMFLILQKERKSYPLFVLDIFHCKEPDFFRCTNKKCVSTAFLCDGQDDCGDNSDERRCENFKVITDDYLFGFL